MLKVGELVKLKAFQDDGRKISQIARRTGHDHETARKYLSTQHNRPDLC
jgi:transposase